MHLSEDKQSLLATYGELQSLVGLLAVKTNSLGVVTAQINQTDKGVKGEWDKLQSTQQELIRSMLTTLASPRQTIHISWTVGDFYYQTVTLVRQAGQEDLVWLNRQTDGELYQLQRVGTDEIKLLLNDILKISSLNDDNSNQNLSSGAVLGLLAASELMRQRYHQSMLDHQTSSTSFTADQLQAILSTAKQSDFRWPLYFWEKSLPVDIPSMAAQIPNALKDLTTAGWMNSSAGKFEFTDNAVFMVEEMLNEQAKTAITIAISDGQNIMIQDSILLLRGPQGLWIYYLLGEQGGVGQIGPSGWYELSQALLSPLLESLTEAAADAENAVRFCSHCGKKLAPGTKFCASCGKGL